MLTLVMHFYSTVKITSILSTINLNCQILTASYELILATTPLAVYLVGLYFFRRLTSTSLIRLTIAGELNCSFIKKREAKVNHALALPPIV